MKNRPRQIGGNPDFDRAHTHHKAGQLDQALMAYAAVLKRSPNHRFALVNAGSILRRKGRFAEALEYFNRALQVKPDDGAAWTNVCNLHLDLDQRKLAIESGRKAVQFEPDSPLAHNNLGRALFRADRFDEAKLSLEHSLRLDPNQTLVWNNLGGVHIRQCRVDDALACYHKALELDPGNVMAHSNLLFVMHFSSRYSPEQIAEAHRAWAMRHEAPLKPRALPPVPLDPSRQRLRVAMLSPDLRDHPVMRFLKPLIDHWPHQQFELCFFSSVTAPDAVTHGLQSKAAVWRSAVGLSDEELARAIRKEQIDILIDLSGHTGASRLPVFAYRPAPVQATWLGYFNTTGMESMDYLIGDPLCIRTGEESRYSERVLRLDPDFVCYAPPDRTPPVQEVPPVMSGQPFTFGSLNQVVKVGDPVVELWSAILRAAPTSRLLLGGRAFNDESTKQSYLTRFAALGIPAERLILQAGVAPYLLMETYNRIDLALDPFPCAGGTTTCEALWMGVPVLSLYGERFCGRHSASHLRAVGLPAFVQLDTQSYLRTALELYRDPSPLAALRPRLRTGMLASRLCDGAAFATAFAGALTTMWAEKAKIASA